MASLKEVTIETIKRLPDECSLEDIRYEIDFVAQVLEGMALTEAREDTKSTKNHEEHARQGKEPIS